MFARALFRSVIKSSFRRGALPGKGFYRSSAALHSVSQALVFASTVNSLNCRPPRRCIASYSPLNCRPPTEAAASLPGRDYERWFIGMENPGGEGATKEQMVDCYVKTLAKVVGSEEEAMSKIYNLSCNGFGCEIDEDTSKKLEGLPGVLYVIAYHDQEPEATPPTLGGEEHEGALAAPPTGWKDPDPEVAANLLKAINQLKLGMSEAEATTPTLGGEEHEGALATPPAGWKDPEVAALILKVINQLEEVRQGMKSRRIEVGSKLVGRAAIREFLFVEKLEEWVKNLDHMIGALEETLQIVEAKK